MSDETRDRAEDVPEDGTVDIDADLIRKSRKSIADAEEHTADSIDRLNESRELLKEIDRKEPPTSSFAFA